jgi:DNA-directed RNA polymerase II subunit RPB2
VTGVCYYHVFRHQAKDNTHSVSKGTIQSLTKQPVQGRSKRGVDFDLEKWKRTALLLTELLHFEKLRDDTHEYNVLVCHGCDTICVTNPCSNCQGTYIMSHSISYSFKLLVQELSMANIRIGLRCR